MNRKIIFLVDDDPTNLMAVRGMLEGHYDVLTLNSGERLIKTLEKRIPDMILLDIEMPGMNGYDTIKALKAKKETADIPVIFLTARTGDFNELEGLSLGAVDYITKPTPSASVLLKRIGAHLVEPQKTDTTQLNVNSHGVESGGHS
ncbi:MAG: response regulator [Chitinispirillales bacterium]|jgi:putative two-component system response regulator|nr:response regulator [Chitinispirillales bacterium]